MNAKCTRRSFIERTRVAFLVASVATLLPPSIAKAQTVDFAILDCAIVDGPTPDTIDLVLHVGVLTPATGIWEVPIDIHLNGQPAEPTHRLTLEKNFLQPCQQTFPDCQLPFPCGFTRWSYKGRGPFIDNWRCLANFNTQQCDCVDPGPPFPHKTLPRPTIPSFFDVFVDLNLEVPESNEENNHCRVFYDPPTPAQARTWGSIKDVYYR